MAARVAWAVIDKNGMKLIKPNWDSQDIELYDLRTDPGESRNLYNAAPKDVSRLQQAWDEWNAQNCDYGEIDFINTFEKAMRDLNDEI